MLLTIYGTEWPIMCSCAVNKPLRSVKSHASLPLPGHTAVLATKPLQLRAPYYGTVFHRT